MNTLAHVYAQRALIRPTRSWFNNWPVNGRVNYPLLFNRDLTAKTAYESVIEPAE